jgi:hypothetical protein
MTVSNQEGNMPATPTATWRRIRATGEWGVAVIAGEAFCETVTVTKRDGTTSEVVLGEYVESWTGRDGIRRCTYRINGRGLPPVATAYDASDRRPGATGRRLDAAVAASRPAPARRVDPPMGTHVVTTDGACSVELTIYRVARTRRGRGYVAAWRLDTVNRTATGRPRWRYCGTRPLAMLSADTLLTEAQARDIGARFGFCANCGRLLTADRSVDRGIGPVCFRRIREAQARRFDVSTAESDEIRTELAARIDRARQAAQLTAEAEALAALTAETYDLTDDNTDPDDDAEQRQMEMAS